MERAKQLVQLIKSNNYKLDITHIQNMARVSHNKANTTKEIRDKAKVTQGEHGVNKFKNKCIIMYLRGKPTDHMVQKVTVVLDL